VATESQSDLNFSVSPVSSSENTGCSNGSRTVGSDENLPKNISGVATESQSVSPVSSLVKSNSNCAENQLYRYQTGPLMDPQSIVALRRRKQNGEKFRRLEKRIPLRSKLDTAKMMEAMGKYVKFLEAQVIMGITISSSFFRIGVAELEPAIFGYHYIHLVLQDWGSRTRTCHFCFLDGGWRWIWINLAKYQKKGTERK
jgi:hypothetical protein